MLNIPDDYEPYRMNCLAGETTVGILCRRPDGGVSDWHANMNKKCVNGVCPACGRDMQETRTGVFTCNAGHLLIVMTNSQATRAHIGRHASKTKPITAKPAQKRIMRPRKNKAILPPLKRTRTEEVEVDIGAELRASTFAADSTTLDSTCPAPFSLPELPCSSNMRTPSPRHPVAIVVWSAHIQQVNVESVNLFS